MASKLNCNNIENRIHQLLDDRLTLTGDPLLMDHARSCVQCRQLVADYDEILDQFDNLPSLAVSLPADWSNENTSTELKTQGRYFPKHTGLLISVAAMLLLVVGLFSTSVDRDPMNSTPIAGTTADASSAGQPLAFSIASRSNRTMGETAEKVTKARAANQDKIFIRQLVFFQPPTIVELAQNTPTIVDSVRLPATSSSWQHLSDRLDPLSPYLQYSAELPGVRNFQSSVSVTLNLLSRTLAKPVEIEPDLGWFPERHFFAAVS